MDNLNQPTSNQSTTQSTNQSVTEQPPDVNPKSSLHSKALLITFALFVILFVALTAFLLASKTKPSSQPRSSIISHPSPTIDPSRESTGSAETANWKTDYRGIYSIQYPRDWTLGYEGDGIITYESPNAVKTQYRPLTRGALLSIAAGTYWDYGKTISSVAGRFFLDCQRAEQGPVFTIDGHTAQQYTVICPFINPGATDILVESKDGVYVIEYDYQPRSDSRLLTTLQKILSTFKFTEQINNSPSQTQGINLEEAAKILPLSPSRVSASQDSGTMLVSWAGTGEDVYYYEIYRKTSTDTKWQLMNIQKPIGDNKGNYQFTDTTVKAGSTYIYGVSTVGLHNNKSAITESPPIVSQ